MATTEEVKTYYDTVHLKTVKKVGINKRHLTILKNLKQVGLQANSKVLEIGCGIGTVSQLILKHIPQGKLVGLDISPESIELAKQYNKSYAHAEFLVNDMSNFTHSLQFDFVVFPDVLEHIPLEQHAHIFETIAKLTSPNAVVLINIPEPNHLNWLRKNHPDKLQIIDQSLSMQDLLNHAYPYGFKLYSMNSYSLFYAVHDYVSIVLKKNMELHDAPLKPYLSRAIDALHSKF